MTAPRKDRHPGRAGLALLALGLAVGAGLPAFAQEAAPPGLAEATRALLDQAAFWRDKGRRDLSAEALQRVYAAAPDDPEVLYRLGLFAAQDKDAAAQAWLAQLRQRVPGDPRVARLDDAIRQGSLPDGGIEEARRLARTGNVTASVAMYRQLFAGGPPPLAHALEYYQTLALTPEGFEEARQGLGQLAANGDGAAAAVLARVLTYREDSRREGIALLARRGPVDASAREDWRRALLWLEARPEDKPLYDAYLALVPDDGAVAGRLAQARAVAATSPVAVAPVAIVPDGRQALERAEQLRGTGRFADAYDVLALALRDTPGDTRLLAALARLYGDGQMYGQAVQVYDAILTREPGNADVIEGAVGAAIGAGDVVTAGRWLKEALARSPAEPGLHVLAARLAAARGDTPGAIRSLETAQALRARQLGQVAGLGTAPAVPAAPETVPGNPFRRDSVPEKPPVVADTTDPARRLAAPRAATAGAVAGDLAATVPSPRLSPLPAPLALTGGPTATAGQTSGGLYLPDGQVRATTGRPAALTPATVPQIATTTSPAPAYAQPVAIPTPAPAPTYPALASATPGTPGLPVATANDPMSRDIARELADLRQGTIPFVRGDVGIRNRDGESGLSALTEVGATLSAAVSPFDEGRLTVSARPVSLESGTPEGDAARRFGLNALVPTTVTAANHQSLATIVENNSGVWNLLTPTEKQILGAAITTPEATTLNGFVTSNPTVVAALTDELRTAITTAVAADPATTLSSFVSANPTIWNGLTTAQESVLSAALAADSYSFDTARMAALRRAPTQDDAGVALAVAYEIGDIKADVGTTPLGFEVQNIVGGVTFAPKLSGTTTLKLTGERRAVADSLLSYAGTIEPFTGKRWGGVTRTGGRVMLSDDDGDVGLYGGGAYYRLEGDNVESNQQLEATVGAYIRPYKTERAELSVGVNLSYLNYEKNLGEFSFGHGGYFSPQNFYSVSFPVEYSGQSRSGKWSYTVGGAIGYQSYDKEAAPFFPTDSKLQTILEDEVSAGLISSAYYAAGSESGVGGNIHGGFDYAFDRQTTVGASASFDSFGDYSESSVMVYVKRLLEVAP